MPFNLGGATVRGLELSSARALRGGARRTRARSSCARRWRSTPALPPRRGRPGRRRGARRPTGLLFLETLLDENASCHIAWGFGAPEIVDGAPGARRRGARGAGVNRSDVHTDVMIGSAGGRSTGWTRRARRPIGSATPILRLTATGCSDRFVRCCASRSCGTTSRPGRVDTVVMAMTDMQGRLQGKRLDAHAFVRDIAEHGAEGCNYLLGVDVDMTPQPGFGITGWERGYGDFVFRPDLRHAAPRDAGSRAPRSCCATWSGTTARRWRPRRDRSCAASSTGWPSAAGGRWWARSWSSSSSARRTPARGRRATAVWSRPTTTTSTTPSSARRWSRTCCARSAATCAAPGLEVEDSKGECNLGQHEVNFRYQDALRMADEHAIYKTAAKEIAHAHGAALTFIAKYDEREGNSCHIHCSFWDGDRNLFPAADGHTFSPLYEHYIAGQVARTAELAFFFAPNVNSYKRFAYGSFAPTGLAWGHDNRTCAFRAVGHGNGMRLESRLAGADANPYLAFAATIAAGLDGIDRELPLPAALDGNAYDADVPRIPGEPARGHPRPRGLRLRPRGLRRRGRGPLPERRAPGAARLRGGGHRLGAAPGVRAPVTRRASADRDLRLLARGELRPVARHADRAGAAGLRRRACRRPAASPCSCRPTTRWWPTRRRCSTSSTACCWSAATTSSRRSTAPSRIH